jgi:hypothetical protein
MRWNPPDHATGPFRWQAFLSRHGGRSLFARASLRFFESGALARRRFFESRALARAVRRRLDVATIADQSAPQ